MTLTSLIQMEMHTVYICISPGNEFIHQLTDSMDYQLRIEMRDWASNQRYAEYQHFHLQPETDMYRMTVGSYTGTAGKVI